MAGILRHIAKSVTDPDASARFYEKTLGLTRAKAYDPEYTTVVYLSDGILSLSLLKFKFGVMAGKDTHPQYLGKEFVGLHHQGFLVDDVEKTGKLAEKKRTPNLWAKCRATRNVITKSSTGTRTRLC